MFSYYPFLQDLARKYAIGLVLYYFPSSMAKRWKIGVVTGSILRCIG